MTKEMIQRYKKDGLHGKAVQFQQFAYEAGYGTHKLTLDDAIIPDEWDWARAMKEWDEGVTLGKEVVLEDELEARAAYAEGVSLYGADNY